MDPLLRNLTALLLFVLPLLNTHLSTHAATISPPPTRRRIIHLAPMGSDDDYEDYEGEIFSRVLSSSMKTPLLRSELCNHDPCKENQEPCNVLKAQTGCLCPGRSGVDQPPHAPRIQALMPVTEGDNTGDIEVRWCAPSSVVSAYRVSVEGREGDLLEFGDSSRLGLVGPLEVGTKVCVQAVNSAGQSSPSEFSCMRYTHSESSDHKLLTWIIVGGVALVLLLVAAVVTICKCQKTMWHSHEELGNLSYSK
ncbi:leucine-rich repeat neuronal protein 4 [Nothobranchius furzeri]|uniref:Leucine-rich repeat neuronal protein 4-like n=2 Tax=Nothobranchius TaxID=28779 RepID=A0A1A7ZFJ4_NOTFU|nr:leucine-rich repeat neuronal protein 4 isoform X2 [Nothobranchius furzeri]KAF7228299.1 leucine-rich repeat neuronal protein 4-like [Nothobranchius furzeri]